ncbi:DUF1697 domain-containing protein [Porifericola rhodea]|uniref:DUF1697 domain-containing protein n=1 Tax=Porifericola rhodea TaxID=930972 RepID=UPI0026658495|nr:DUF1697 domain-containing protein [Porifericola rhodea]WKN30731.1 DUF1697 domain-containing protein [Porifericola rhodea]
MIKQRKHIYIAYLRGINVGGHRKIKMQELKALLNRQGFHELNTYIQSGNLVFYHADKSAGELQTDLETLILQHFGFEVKVLLLSKDEIDHILSSNPYLQDDTDINKLYVSMLDQVPTSEALEHLQSYSFPGDEFTVLGKTIFLYCGNGYGKTKLSNDFFEKKLKQSATTRNWKTMLKMQSMADDLLASELK